MTALGEQAVKQEARRVLRKLSAPRQGLFARDDGFVLGRNAASRLRVEAQMVAAFAREGWIMPDGENYLLTDAGRAFLVRESGSGEAGFTAQHGLLQETVLRDEGQARRVTVNLGESPMARLQARGLVTATQFAAAEKLRRDFTLAQLTPRMGVNWAAPVVSGSRGAGGDALGDTALDARRRVNKAMTAVGAGLSDLLLDVCCHLKVLERCEDGRGWARRSARVVLMLALDRLAAHYGMDVVVTRAPIRSWAQDDAPQQVNPFVR